jgi:hypothetical protein
MPKREEKVTAPTVQDAFAQWMIAYHTGKDQVVTARQMTQWGRGVDIREMVHNLRLKGHPICSGSTGYYYGTTSDDLDATINIMQSRINEITRVKNALSKTYRKMKLEENGLEYSQ